MESDWEEPSVDHVQADRSDLSRCDISTAPLLPARQRCVYMVLQINKPNQDVHREKPLMPFYVLLLTGKRAVLIKLPLWQHPR